MKKKISWNEEEIISSSYVKKWRNEENEDKEEEIVKMKINMKTAKWKWKYNGMKIWNNKYEIIKIMK